MYAKAGHACLNRTFMELKRIYFIYILTKKLSLNRTFMELKRINKDLEDLYERGLNRSFMELKPDHALELEFVGVS